MFSPLRIEYLSIRSEGITVNRFGFPMGPPRSVLEKINFVFVYEYLLRVTEAWNIRVQDMTLEFNVQTYASVSCYAENAFEFDPKSFFKSHDLTYRT